MEINEKIAKYQEAKNFDDEKLAKKLDLSIEELNDYKNGSKELNISLANKMCKVFGITLDEFVNGETETSIRKKHITAIIVFSILLVILPVSFPFVMMITDMFDIIFMWLFIPTLWVAGIAWSITEIVIHSRKIKKKTQSV